MLVIAIALTAAVLALIIPLRWGVAGFLGAAVALFAVQAAINTAMGFEGTSIEESLLLFNGSWTSYIGFNLQITYRAFALPLLALAVPFVFRATRR